MADPDDLVHDLIRTVRELRIARTQDPRHPVRLEASAAHIKQTLSHLRDLLDKIDEGAWSSNLEIDTERLAREHAALSRALRALFVHIREQGMDDKKALAIARTAANPAPGSAVYESDVARRAKQSRRAVPGAPHLPISATTLGQARVRHNTRAMQTAPRRTKPEERALHAVTEFSFS